MLLHPTMHQIVTGLHKSKEITQIHLAPFPNLQLLLKSFLVHFIRSPILITPFFY